MITHTPFTGDGILSDREENPIQAKYQGRTIEKGSSWSQLTISRNHGDWRGNQCSARLA